MAQSADHQATHACGIAEAHLRLGRMDVDIDLGGREFDKQRRHRMPVARKEICIGGADHARQQPVLHWTAVDEQILVLRAAAIECRQAGKPGDQHAFALRIDRNCIVAEFAAEDRRQAPQPRLRGIARFGL